MSILKKASMTLLAVASVFFLSACWESKTENAVEDVGEQIEETTDDVQDAAEEAGEAVEEQMDTPE